MTAYEIYMELNDVTPLTIRQLMIPSDITFEKLHEIISLVFNFNNDNKYSFTFNDLTLEIKDTKRINRDTIDARYEKIDKYFNAFNKVTYLNDFWTVSLNISESDYEKSYPQLISYKGFYNPIPDIQSIDEFSYFLELKKNRNEATADELKIINKLRRLNKLKIQKNLMLLFDIPHVMTKRAVVEVNKKSTLDRILKK